MHPAKIIIILLLLIIVAIFTFQNTGVVDIKFMFFKAEMSKSLLFLGTLFSGIIIGMILSLLNFMARKKSEKKMIQDTSMDE